MPAVIYGRVAAVVITFLHGFMTGGFTDGAVVGLWWCGVIWCRREGGVMSVDCDARQGSSCRTVLMSVCSGRSPLMPEVYRHLSSHTAPAGGEDSCQPREKRGWVGEGEKGEQGM